MKPTVQGESTTHVVNLAMEDVTDADVMTVLYGTQQFYPDRVVITYTHSYGEWDTDVDATVSGPRKIKAGRLPAKGRCQVIGTARWGRWLWQPPQTRRTSTLTTR